MRRMRHKGGWNTLFRGVRLSLEARLSLASGEKPISSHRPQFFIQYTSKWGFLVNAGNKSKIRYCT